MRRRAACGGSGRDGRRTRAASHLRSCSRRDCRRSRPGPGRGLGCCRLFRDRACWAAGARRCAWGLPSRNPGCAAGRGEGEARQYEAGPRVPLPRAPGWGTQRDFRSLIPSADPWLLSRHCIIPPPTKEIKAVQQEAEVRENRQLHYTQPNLLTFTANLGPPLAGRGALFFLFCSMATGASGNNFSSAARAA